MSARWVWPVGIAVLATGCLSKPSYDCAISVAPAQLDDQLGMNGGVPSGKADCGKLPAVGIGLTMTHDLNVNFHAKTAIKAQLRCGAVSNHDARYETGDTRDTMLIGGSVTNIDGPFFATCPEGQVLIGLAGHIVGNNGLFNSVTVFCSPLDERSMPTGEITRQPMLETGTETALTDASCEPGRVVQGIESMSGSELDQLKLDCASPACMRP